MGKRKISEDEIKLRQNPVNEFTCCGTTRAFKEHRAHLIEHHKLNSDQLNGKKSMLSHIDGDYWYSYSWQWELTSGLKFTQHTMTARDQDDPMRY